MSTGIITLLYGSKQPTEVVLFACAEDGAPLHCAACGYTFQEEDNAIHYYCVKHNPQEAVFCVPCSTDLDVTWKALGIPELRVVIIANQPDSSMFRIVSPVEVTTTNRNLFGVATLPSIRTINRAVRSGRPEYTFDDTLQVGWTTQQEKKRELELEEIDNDVARFLESCQTATPVLQDACNEWLLLDDQTAGKTKVMIDGRSKTESEAHRDRSRLSDGGK